MLQSGPRETAVLPDTFVYEDDDDECTEQAWVSDLLAWDEDAPTVRVAGAEMAVLCDEVDAEDRACAARAEPTARFEAVEYFEVAPSPAPPVEVGLTDGATVRSSDHAAPPVAREPAAPVSAGRVAGPTTFQWAFMASMLLAAGQVAVAISWLA